jgi:hypothetical protein
MRIKEIRRRHSWSIRTGKQFRTHSINIESNTINYCNIEDTDRKPNLI